MSTSGGDNGALCVKEGVPTTVEGYECWIWGWTGVEEAQTMPRLTKGKQRVWAQGKAAAGIVEGWKGHKGHKQRWQVGGNMMSTQQTTKDMKV